MNAAGFLAIALFCVLMGAGQILFKLAAMRLPTEGGLVPKLIAIAASPPVWAAASLYAVASVLWVLILTRVPISIAYPITSLTLVLVPVVSWAVFGDPLSLRMFCGMLTILAGVWLIAGRAP